MHVKFQMFLSYIIKSQVNSSRPIVHSNYSKDQITEVYEILGTGPSHSDAK